MKLSKSKLHDMIMEVLSEQEGPAPDSLVSRSLRRTIKDLRGVNARINHRLYGEGAMKDRGDGVPSLSEPFLNTFDKQRAYRASKDIAAAQDLIQRALEDLDKIDLGYP